MRTADLEAEWRNAQEALSPSDALELEAAGFPRGVIMHMIGIARVRLSRGCYEPDEDGKWAFISPVCIGERPYTGGLLSDLICWDTGNTDAWALRYGIAEWMGCAEHNEPFPTPIRRSPADWLRHGCTGLALLTKDRVRRYWILSDCNDALTYLNPRKAVFAA